MFTSQSKAHRNHVIGIAHQVTWPRKGLHPGVGENSALCYRGRKGSSHLLQVTPGCVFLIAVIYFPHFLFSHGFPDTYLRQFSEWSFTCRAAVISRFVLLPAELQRSCCRTLPRIKNSLFPFSSMTVPGRCNQQSQPFFSPPSLAWRALWLVLCWQQ